MMGLLPGCAASPDAALPRSGIVSLNPCTDAILTEVAEPGQIKAVSAYSHDPASSSMDVAVARRFRATTGSVEEIAALRPALVLSGTFTPPATRTALARLGIALVEVPIATSVEQSEDQVRQLAALAGHPERGERLIGQIETALAFARPGPWPAVPALVWEAGGIVPGDQTLIVDLLRRTGFANAAAARGLGQADMLPLEKVLAMPPRLILAVGTGAADTTASTGIGAGGGHAGEDRLLAHPALAKLPDTLRAPFASSLLWCGGPTIIRAAHRLAAIRRDPGLRDPGGRAPARYVSADGIGQQVKGMVR